MPHRHARILIITAAYTGMRFGELAALTRANLRLDQARLHVNGTVGALHEVGGKRWLGPPKTQAAVRDIRLPAFVLDGLEQLLRAHPYDTVFCTESGTCLWRTTFVQRIWRPGRDGHPNGRIHAILPGLRFHNLRHTDRTWLDEDNLPEALKANASATRSPASGASTPTSPNPCTHHYSPLCNNAGSTPTATGNGRRGQHRRYRRSKTAPTNRRAPMRKILESVL
jgi:integrase